MKKRFALFKVKKGKLNQWKQWCNLLMAERKQEALESFKYENVESELCYTFRVGNTDYVLGEISFNGEYKKSNMDLKINQDHHKNKKECLEYISELESLFDLK